MSGPYTWDNLGFGRSAWISSPFTPWGLCVGLFYTYDTSADRKSTRLNSSHSQISYAVFCLKKKNEIDHLDGILFLDHLTAIKRNLLLSQWKKSRKEQPGYLKDVTHEPAVVRQCHSRRRLSF